MLFPLDKPFDRSVTYTLNSQGYRCPEWQHIDWANSYLLFGCSVVQGVGLSDDQTLDRSLERLLGYPVINLGVGGGSLPFILANSYKLIDSGVTPRGVILVSPEPSRLALFTEPKVYHVGAWSNYSWYKVWVNNNNAEFYGQLSRRGIETVWKYNNIPYYEVHQPNVPGPADLPKYVDRAQDNVHPGPDTIDLWAQHIYSKIKPA